MANIVQLKRSSVAGKQPNVADLQVGELAVNLADGILYSKDTTGNIIVVGSSNTSNVEEGINLYFTNSRAISALTAGQNIDIDANGLITANVEVINEITSVVFGVGNPGDKRLTGDGSNTIFDIGFAPSSANTIFVFVDSILQKPDTSYNVSGNTIVFTTAPDSNSIIDVRYFGSEFANLTTSNVTEVNNLYYTNARVYSNVILLDYATNTFVESVYDQANTATVYATTAFDSSNTKANIVDLTTANVAEVTNLYYTDARVYSNVVQLGYATESYVNSEVANLVNSAPSTLDTLNELAAALGNDNNFATTTATLIGQSFNQANAAYDAANTKTVAADLTTANVAEVTNLYYTDARAFANLTSATTTSLSEGSNLYFSNVRSIEAVELAVTKLDVVNNSTSAYRFDQYGTTTDNPSLYVNAGETLAFDLAVSGHPFVIRDSAGGSNVNTGLIHVADDGTITTESSAQGKETGVLYWKVPWDFRGNTYVYQCTVHGGMVGNIVVRDPSVVAVDSINASNVIEDGNTTTGNVFFTNARALSAIVDNINTSNVVEGVNLYFTNTRAISAFTAGSNITIDANGLISSTAVSGGGSGTGNITSVAGVLEGDVSNTQLLVGIESAGITTSNVAEGSNIYFTNTRVIAALTAGDNIVIDSNGLITSSATGSFSGNTDSVPEGVTNLYFTNSRSVGALTGGSGITIDSNGLITSTSTGGGGSVGLAYSEVESNVITFESGVLEYDMGRTVSAPEDVLIIVEGLVQIANVDYTVNANILTFTNESHANANIELRFFGIDSSTNVYTVATSSFSQANAAYDAANTKTVAADLTTANVAELTNLYFTNARVYSNVVQLGYATESYVNSEVANLVNSAPSTLDTLNELASALGNDNNFATTTATLIGNSYNQANAAYDQANAAYEQANTSVTGPILLNNTNITSNIAIVSGQNGLAVGPLTLDPNVSITIATGQRFIIL